MSSVTVYQNRLKAIRNRTAEMVAEEWDSLPDLDQSRRTAFARAVTPIVASGQLLAARTTSAYIARAAKISTVPIRPVQVIGAASRRGVDPLDEYERPFGAAWATLGNGADFDAAKNSGRARLVDLARMDVWLATRAAATIIDRATPRITSWVRVADAGSCDLCSAVDGQPLDAAADLAGHPGCGCTSQPITTDTAPTEAADPQAIDVHEHDELGPVLYEAGHHFAHA